MKKKLLVIAFTMMCATQVVQASDKGGNNFLSLDTVSCKKYVAPSPNGVDLLSPIPSTCEVGSPVPFSPKKVASSKFRLDTYSLENILNALEQRDAEYVGRAVVSMRKEGKLTYEVAKQVNEAIQAKHRKANLIKTCNDSDGSKFLISLTNARNQKIERQVYRNLHNMIYLKNYSLPELRALYKKEFDKDTANWGELGIIQSYIKKAEQA